MTSQFSVESYTANDFDALASRVEAYYREDQKIEFDRAQLKKTIAAFTAGPDKGRIDMLHSGGVVAGYAILATFWSNEYGGTIVFLDEIFIDAGHRQKGFGRWYIQSLIKARPFGAVALRLEVTPQNIRAKALYEAIGFVKNKNADLVYNFGAGYHSKDI